MSELEVISGSDSGHCCFEASVRDIETGEHFCECFEPKDAEKIVKAVNYHGRLVEALRDCMECLDIKDGAEPYDTARALLKELEAQK